MIVPFVDLGGEIKSVRGDILARWEQLLDGASFIGGAAVEAFEKAFADYCQADHAIGVANGTDALVLALKAMNIGSGDDVLLPANSFVATAEAVVHAGATPVFVDVNADTYNIDIDQIERCITPRTKAVIAVHLYGQPAEMDPILEIAKRHGLRVIEDAAQAHGARYHGRRAGSMGDAGCFSFYPAKNLGACGDGGAVVTNNAEIAERVRKLRDHGGTTKYQHDVIGYNSRLDSLQAAALHCKLESLDERNALRRQRAAEYNGLISKVEGVVAPSEPRGIEGVFHLYVIRVEKGNRSSLQSYLAQNGVQTGIHYPSPIHRTPAFARFSGAECPVAERYADAILSLPMYPGIERHHLQHVVSLLSQYLGQRNQTASAGDAERPARDAGAVPKSA
jgi:dTDP-4-amino-4,6-dideoxygalactose transaminase